MKKINILQIRTAALILALFSVNMLLHAQTTLYQENCGTPTATTLIQNYTGWQNANVLYTGNGTCDVRTSSASSGYGLASGGGNVMINDTVKWFQISGINTSADTNISLYCGLRKTTAENGSNFVVEVSADSVQWQRIVLEDTLPSGTGTSGWYRVRFPGVISCPNLHIRFSNLSSAEYRIDDIALVVGEETNLQTVSKPTFSPAGGTYYEPKTVTIASATEGSTIYYTMDGSSPTTSSNLYQGPLTINNSVTVKTFAVHPEMYDSEVATASYIILDTNSLVALPLNLSTNSSVEHLDITQQPGFRGYHLGSSYADGSVKFESSHAGEAVLVAHLDSSPDQLLFEMKGKNGGSNPSAYEGIMMEIAESADGQQWNTLRTLSENDISVEDFVRFNGFSFQMDTRFIRWKLLASSKGNTQLNNIVITKREDMPGDSTAILDYNQVPIAIYPNPTQNILNVVSGGVRITSCTLLDLSGREIDSWHEPNCRSIALSGLPVGMYLLNIYTPEGMIQRKVVKY